MAFDFKKEYKEYYLPAKQPRIVDVPPMNFIAVAGSGDPNLPGGAYQQALAMLYAVAYTIKMSKKGDRRIDGYFDFVVPPLEGFWWQGDGGPVDFAHKERFAWISAIRMPDFVTAEDVAWAKEQGAVKKKLDCSAVELMTVDEGLCVQCLHMGPYDDEPATIEAMDAYARAQGYAPDLTAGRRHHEIYLSDARRVAPERLRTVIRHPVRAV
ncbi:GyrI-like small molecule binding domain-containing protein [Bifidobacterium italicum]|uniref:GyrI-like small molecule binding domain-containing protein n=1 Tax=Bifidobacterium italicum TaxID=1960968 RepID=A0A2A2EI67_9BIFI|nr:GyrI-like domain-containing protein [Bifidobacterium italicum]PAU68869.1 GyrI-like small molecule binding domain-containing protein [Bifidobacterium italicum]